MREPLIDQITSVVWYDARKEKPKRCGPFLCVDTNGKIFTQKYFPKAKQPRREKNRHTVLFWGEVQIPVMPSLVQDFVCRNFKYLNDNELKVMVDDINFAERIDQLGDERIDKPGWLKFRERINSELEKRKAKQNA